MAKVTYISHIENQGCYTVYCIVTCMVKDAVTIKFLFNILRTCEDAIGKCKPVNGKYKTVC